MFSEIMILHRLNYLQVLFMCQFFQSFSIILVIANRNDGQGIELSINPTVAHPGDSVNITCRYSGEYIYTYWPKLRINGIQYIGTELDALDVMYTRNVDMQSKKAILTIAQRSVSNSNNGTTYQCFFSLIDGELASNVSTLIVYNRQAAHTSSLSRRELLTMTTTTKAGSTIYETQQLKEVSTLNTPESTPVQNTSAPFPDVNSPQGTQDVVVIATSASAGAVILVVSLLVVAATIGLVVKCAHKPTNRKEGSGDGSDQVEQEEVGMTENPAYDTFTFPAHQMYSNL